MSKVCYELFFPIHASSRFFNNGVTLAILQIDRLKIYFVGSKTDGEICLITSEEISSYPELFFVFKV